MSHVVPLKPDVNEDVVATLEELLVKAKNGEIKSLIAFYDTGPNCTYESAGKIHYGSLVFAVDLWKFRRLASNAGLI